MIPGWYSESGMRGSRCGEAPGSAIRIWVTGTGSAGWQCMNCGLGGEAADPDISCRLAASHECLPGLDNDGMTLSYWSSEHMAALALIQDGTAGRCTCTVPHGGGWRTHPEGCPRRYELAVAEMTASSQVTTDDIRLAAWGSGMTAAGPGQFTAGALTGIPGPGTCTCRTASSSVTGWRAHTGSCPAGTGLAQLAMACGLVTADDVRRHAGLAPLAQPGLCWGPHPPGQDWPCSCTPVSWHGDRAEALAPEPPSYPPGDRGAVARWLARPARPFPYMYAGGPVPVPVPARTCAGCGLSDHMRPAGYGTGSPLFPHLCTYCAELRGLSQAGRWQDLALQRYRVRAPVLTLLATWIQALLAGLLTVRAPRAARRGRGIRQLGTVVIPVPVAILVLCWVMLLAGVWLAVHQVPVP